MTWFRDVAVRMLVGLLAIMAIASTLFLWLDKYAAQAFSPAVRASSRLSYFYLAVALESVVILSAALLGLVLIWKAARQSGVQFLALFLSGLAFFQAGAAADMMLRSLNLPSAATLTSVMGIPVIVIGMVALIRFTALFPAPLQKSHLNGSGKVGRAVSSIQRASLDSIGLWAIGGIAIALLAAENLALRSQAYAPEVQVGDVLIPVALALAVLNLRAGYRVSDTAARLRLHWVIEGMLIATFAIALRLALKLIFLTMNYSPAIHVWDSLLYTTGLLGLIACLALAVFYTGAMDTRLVVKRTSVAGTATLVILLMFIGVESVLSNALENRLPERWGGWIGGIAVGLTVNSMHRRIERIVDRYVIAPDPARETARIL